MKSKNRLMTVLLLLLTMLVVTAGCGNDNARKDEGSTNGAVPAPAEQPKPKKNVPDPNASHPVVTIEMDSGKTIKAELYPEVAPNTVNNFISLVKKGYYDGTGFHRVIPGFMIQGGDPEGTGAGGPGYSIAGEFTQNGFQNDLLHTRGVLSMARSEAPDSAGSQFFIMHADSPHLDNLYAAFGKVIEGMDVVDEIAELPRNGMDRPADPLPTMKKVTVDTLGKDYPEPEKQ
ncbi:peptidylprolyl isomerase [Paenibacillus sp. DMB20]|uniref:peptidylprolyl isomerase n=1 Tax=Paenibacillus sp. DMB20 TaxID=1642570 RepID=UPI000627FB87|nr:peptidylprolyl isomerase [Paenibacillus sp. DMB20]KKO54238.1 peptidylprolyl isomerase [Paenibacillus sp. DMB20]